MFHPLFGYSLQKGAKIIAIADLVIVFLSTTLRFVVYDVQEFQEYEIETEYITTNETAADSQFNGTEIATHDSAAAANLTAHILEILKQSNKAVEEQHEHYLALTIATLVITGVIYILYMCLEVWLCRLLMRASNNRDGSACKTWFWVRLCVTMVILMFSIVGIATLKHDWVDWVLEPLNLYRIYELIVINEFKREIAATSGRVKLRA
ncbi:uncharacterized protein LOC110858445 [Folsomia candida]|uniref:tRNA uridine 5-carboxymethylaminomethyl modification enzyme MnmG n=1 Tax=Folsomia candida TaxID=158441 RepID=A0A226DED8_FOLCA|nr:uncharacterized protein LOC110858445 [Folsomia candida]OXA43543.1 tRNA uridine 5-carboxymethylaminomethyl modification enzyme MnmG [Folsomia candida]